MIMIGLMSSGHSMPQMQRNIQSNIVYMQCDWPNTQDHCSNVMRTSSSRRVIWVITIVSFLQFQKGPFLDFHVSVILWIHVHMHNGDDTDVSVNNISATINTMERTSIQTLVPQWIYFIIKTKKCSTTINSLEGCENFSNTTDNLQS